MQLQQQHMFPQQQQQHWHYATSHHDGNSRFPGGLVNRRMSSTIPVARNRSLSMEEYDQPKGATYCTFNKNRKYSTTTTNKIGDESPIHERNNED
ncbi:unnamed protein product [Trichobilharzia regenti]|nr:unnamed protein product [Trichobilharzia regenti]